MKTFMLRFPMRGGRVGEIELEWVMGKPLRRYLHEPPLSEHHLLGIRKRCVIMSQTRKRLRLNAEPQPGDKISITRVV